MEGGTNLCGLIPPLLYVPNRCLRLSPAAPLRLLADKILILVCFLDPGQRSYAAFTKRGSLLAGPLVKRLCHHRRENKQNPGAWHRVRPLRCNFAPAAKDA